LRGYRHWGNQSCANHFTEPHIYKKKKKTWSEEEEECRNTSLVALKNRKEEEEEKRGKREREYRGKPAHAWHL
jgi:hypothetical protein